MVHIMDPITIGIAIAAVVVGYGTSSYTTKKKIGSAEEEAKKKKTEQNVKQRSFSVKPKKRRLSLQMNHVVMTKNDETNSK